MQASRRQAGVDLCWLAVSGQKISESRQKRKFAPYPYGGCGMARQGCMKSGRSGKVAKMFGRHGSPQDAEGTIGASTAVAAAALKAEGAGANLELDPLLTDCSRETPAAATLSAPQSSKLRFAVAFARIVSLLMRSQDHRYYALIDLEWLLV